MDLGAEGAPAGQGVITRGLARVGQAHEPETLHLSALLSWESARPPSATGPTRQARTADLAVHGDVTGVRPDGSPEPCRYHDPHVEAH